MQARRSLFILTLCVFSIACAQNTIDSVLQRIRNVKDDTAKFTAYKKYINDLTFSDPQKALSLIPEARSLAGSEHPKIGQVLFLEGAAYEYQGKYQEAIQKYFAAVKEFEVTDFKGRPWRLGLAYDYIGGAYSSMKNFSEGIKYKYKAISEYAASGNKSYVAITKFNLGNIYLLKGESAKALQIIDSSMTVFAELEDYSSLAVGNNTMGAVHFMNNEFNDALKYFKAAYNYQRKNTDKVLLVTSMLNVGETYYKLGLFDSALHYSRMAKEIAEREGFTKELATIYENLGNIFEAQGNFPKAIESLKYSVYMRDSLYQAETQKQIQELSVKYNTEKREKENEVLRIQKANAELSANKQRLVLFGVTGVLVLIAALLFFILRAYREKKRTNRELEIKNVIIEEKNRLVESRNKDIHDSIHYAQRIQAAILPPDKLWFSILPDSFVLYKPKDILSGDFYWIEETATHIFFAAADCTGHGVPGALMSIVNFNLLNKAVLEKSMTDPGRILDAVNNWLTESLHQTYQESAVRDGMDIALCSVEKSSGQVFYACANNPVYVVNGDKLEILHGDNFPVGAYIEEMKRNFTTKEIPGGKDQHIYIFTDGYADQFGGPKGKKFKYKQLQEKITGIQQLTLQKQKHELSRIFDDWKGEFEQVDDVLIIGVKIV